MTTGLPHQPSSRLRVIGLLIVSSVVLTLGALVLIVFGACTLFLARGLYAKGAAVIAKTLLRVWGIRMAVHRDGPWPTGQVVYVSNHPCTLDLFMLVALGLPHARFFLSGFLQKYIPLGIIARMMGTFFTVPQDRPAERVEIFKRADRILRRTGESVYLSPEGQRVTNGEIGRFNKGAFHLATSLGVPIVPLYFDVPESVDPGRGFDARPGTVHVYVLPTIDTSEWRIESVPQHRDDVHARYLAWHRELSSRVRGIAA